MKPSLDAILDASEALLAEGAADPGSAWRNSALATIDAAGVPQARTVVLRRYDKQGRIVEMHTDTRSAKFAELAAAPAACLHNWDAARKIQLRLTGRATLHSGQDADAAWAALRPQTRDTYRTQPGPGTAIVQPSGIAQASEAKARAVFCVVRFSYETLDYLHLAPAGHLRARFSWRGGTLQSQFLVP